MRIGRDEGAFCLVAGASGRFLGETCRTRKGIWDVTTSNLTLEGSGLRALGHIRKSHIISLSCTCSII